MAASIDCLLIGHNEMDFNVLANSVFSMGKDSPAYRDLKLNFIWHQGKRHTVTDILNLYAPESSQFRMGDVFSTTLAYLATYLDKHRLSFDLINDYQQEKDALKNKLIAGNILSVAITTTLYTFSSPIVEICKFIREHNKHVKIIIGGPFILNMYYTPHYEKTLQQFLKATNADILVRSSEGEATLVKIINTLKENETIDDIPNITYLKNGTLRITDIDPENNPLDDNIINWNLFSKRLGSWVALRTSVSCPFNCFYCGFNQRAGKFRTCQVSSIEREMDMVQSIGTVKSINFIDSTFNFPPERFKEVLRMMIRKKYSFKWNGYFRVQFADEEAVKLMEDSGCEGIYIGIESGSQQILNSMNKGVSLKQYQKGMNLLKKTNIVTHTNYMVGFLGETRETVRETVNFIKDFDSDFYRIQLWYLDPGTPVWEKRDEHNVKGSYFMWSHDTANSQTASDWIDAILMEEIPAVWLPVHNFNFHNMFRLVHNGMDIKRIKGFLKGFYRGIQEGIAFPEKTEVSEGVISQIKQSFRV
jgi:radical SAM PhpK family P-methyltransferase